MQNALRQYRKEQAEKAQKLEKPNSKLKVEEQQKHQTSKRTSVKKQGE